MLQCTRIGALRAAHRPFIRDKAAPSPLAQNKYMHGVCRPLAWQPNPLATPRLLLPNG